MGSAANDDARAGCVGRSLSVMTTLRCHYCWFLLTLLSDRCGAQYQRSSRLKLMTPIQRTGGRIGDAQRLLGGLVDITTASSNTAADTRRIPYGCGYDTPLQRFSQRCFAGMTDPLRARQWHGFIVEIVAHG